MADNAKNGTDEKPVFDFGKMSQKAGNRINRLMALMQHLGKRIDAAAPETDIAPMLDELEVMQAEAMGLVFACIVSLPGAWLVDNAPSGIDYAKYDDAIQHIRLDRFEKIGAAYQEAKAGN